MTHPFRNHDSLLLEYTTTTTTNVSGSGGIEQEENH
jgi:hypothetical protein